jgi:hypothetical protein
LLAATAGLGLAQEHSCTCKANGRNYEQGQHACIKGRLMQCSMQLNNSSWKIVAETCPQTELQPKPQIAVSPNAAFALSFPSQ